MSDITIIKICYSIEPRDKIYVKGFSCFSKNIGKNLSNKYSQKLLDSAKKFTLDAIRTASKKEIQKATEATGHLIGNKTADKTSVSRRSSKELHSKNGLEEAKHDLEVPKERYKSPEKR